MEPVLILCNKVYLSTEKKTCSSHLKPGRLIFNLPRLDGFGAIKRKRGHHVAVCGSTLECFENFKCIPMGIPHAIERNCYARNVCN
mgnify:CR=1 FL=1